MSINLNSLSQFERATLIALVEACNYSPNAHPPEERILSKFASHLRGDAKKCLGKLAKRGYCIKHPTRGSTTYQTYIEVINAIRNSS